MKAIIACNDFQLIIAKSKKVTFFTLKLCIIVGLRGLGGHIQVREIHCLFLFNGWGL